MKQFVTSALIAGALSMAAPAHAQDNAQTREGFDLMGEGIGLILDGLMAEIQPALDEIRPLLEEEFVPFLERMGGLMDDLTHYDLPERLPNGDIVIRRSPDAPPFQPPLAEPDAPGDEIEL